MSMNSKQIDKLAKKIWDYQKLNEKLEKADCIFVLGCVDTRLAKRSSELYSDGWAPLILFSGNYGTFSSKDFDKPEAEIFANIALKQGIPRNKILIENKSTNTGENIQFSRELLRKKGYDIKKIIAVTTPFSERRVYVTFKKQWPEMNFIVTSPQISFDDYPDNQFSKEKMINTMTGNLQRIKTYPEKGFQIVQEIPNEVWVAYQQLAKLGYDKYRLENN